MRITIKQLRHIIKESVHQVLLEQADAEEIAEEVAAITAGVPEEQLTSELEGSLSLPALRKFVSLPRRQAVPFFSSEPNPPAAWLAVWRAADALVATRDLF